MSRKNSTQRKSNKILEQENACRASLITCYNNEQENALEVIRNNTITFLIGPAGTGKTHIAIAYAICEFLDNKYKKIIMTRPAVEAGERLGSLPGLLEEKIHPYMIPLLDFLEEKLQKKFIQKCFEDGQFEIAPLGFFRGRNFKDSFILLDESQNATKEQILMCMTRIGQGSKMIINGDPQQSDLNGKGKLLEISKKLSEIDSIGRAELTYSVRHPLVDKITKKFEEFN